MFQFETKTCQNCKNDFIIEPEDFEFYKKIKVPAPTFCPKCRLQRRLLWRNERTLYRRKCDAPGHNEMIISFLSVDKPYKVYDQKYWWSDEWDTSEYGREYNFSKPFFEQLKSLLDDVPKASLSTEYTSMVNSEYSNWAGWLKNCYLVTDADYVEDSAYGSGVFEVKDSYDCDNIAESQLCYSSYGLTKCYKTIFSLNCSSCVNVAFSKNCHGCNDCFGCANLKNKSYHIFNKPYSKEEYLEKINNLFNGDVDQLNLAQAKAEKLWMSYPEKYFKGNTNVNSLGDHIYQTKNTKYGFLVSFVEDSKFVALLHSKSTKDCYDYADWGLNAQLLYECIACGDANSVKFSNLVWGSSKNVEYSYFSRNLSDCFGCVGLKKKQYCILNKQYTKEEYEELILKIKKHMDEMVYVSKGKQVYKYGEFLPPDLSLFAYNETTTQEYFPLTKEQAIEQGYSWKDPEERNIPITIKSDQLPDHIKDVKDDILNQVIQCANNSDAQRGRSPDQDASGCTTAFKIIPQELEFYRKMNLPLPRLCPNCRHYQRIKQRNPLKLWKRKCQCNGQTGNNPNNPNIYQNTIAHTHGTEPCPNEFETTYSPDRKEIVYCEKCYNSEVA